VTGAAPAYRERDRAGAIELALELLATGRVRGVSADHDPAELTALFGEPDYVTDTDWTQTRHYGLLEEYCSRPSPEVPFRSDFFMAQLRWLKKPLKWKVLGPELRRLGYHVVLRLRPDLGADYWTVAESGSSASIFRRHVYKVSTTSQPPYPVGMGDFNAVHRTVYAAIARPGSAWPDRLADPDWLRTAERTVFTVVSEHPSRAAEAVAVHAFLLDRAAKVWPADEWAYRRAVFAAEHRDLPGVPTPDAVAASCLAALPMDRAAAARLPSDWRAIAPADVYASKVTHALLRCARDAGPQEPVITAELHRWAPLLRRLC
jgi:hypothetical protein